MDRSFSSCSVLEVIGSHRPQYFRLVMLGEEDKDGSEGFARLPICCAADSFSSKVTRHHRLHPPPKPQTSQATKYWYKITVLTFG